MLDSKLFDHTLLKAFATKEDIVKLCAEAKKYNFKSVCVNPYWIPVAKEELKGSDVLVCTVIGFPLGANTIETKVFETKDAVAKGADECDIVINIGEAKAGNFDYIEKELKAFVEAAGKNVVLEIEVEGARQIREKCPEALTIYIIPPSMEELERRIRGRKTEPEEVVQQRLEKAQKEMETIGEYKYVVCNDDIKLAADIIRVIIKRHMEK